MHLESWSSVFSWYVSGKDRGPTMGGDLAPTLGGRKKISRPKWPFYEQFSFWRRKFL